MSPDLGAAPVEDAAVVGEDCAQTVQDGPVFQVRSVVYTGPFHLLADLVAKRKLDITAFALAEVTGDFLAYIAAHPDLSQATEFLLIGATLLDIKAARLLPGVEESEEDLELLEAQDLLISRLIQYQTYKEATGHLEELLEANRLVAGRVPGKEPVLKSVLAQLRADIDPERLARLAAGALYTVTPQVLIENMHDPLVSVSEQTQVISARLREARTLTFRELVADAKTLPVVISRFLALLDMYRSGLVGFTQDNPLGKLILTWQGSSQEPDLAQNLEDEWE